MRNLKRTLSLVMAMALIVGMMVVSASAVSSDFNDSAEITNTEAVDVMTAIGVFEGTDKGAFNPTGILTREQAAKIVAVMLLGEEDANKLSTNSTTFNQRRPQKIHCQKNTKNTYKNGRQNRNSLIPFNLHIITAYFQNPSYNKYKYIGVYHHRKQIRINQSKNTNCR